MFIIYEFLFNRVSVASGGQPNERSSIEPELLLDTLRSNDATGARTSLKKSICVLSVLIAIIELIIPTHLLCTCQL